MDLPQELAAHADMLRNAFMGEWRSYWHWHQEDAPHRVLGAACVVAAQQVAAKVAIDIGLDRDAWLASCTEAYDAMMSEAPKFGA